MEKKTVKVGWVYEVRRNDAIAELNNRGIEYEEDSNLNELRKLLANHIKTSNSAETEQKEEVVDAIENKEDSQVDSKQESNSTENSSESESDMSTDSPTPKLEFCFDRNDWEVFIDHLEIFFIAKNTPDDKKAATMLTLFDEDGFKLIRSLAAPAKPLEKSFDDLKKLMEDHLNPAPSEVME